MVSFHRTPVGKSKQRVKVHFKKRQRHLESLAKSFVLRRMEKGVKNSGTGLGTASQSDGKVAKQPPTYQADPT